MPQAPHAEARPGSYPMHAGGGCENDSRQLGHLNFDTTMNIYTHFEKENDRIVSEAFRNALS